MTRYTVKFRLQPGHSSIDHVADELIAEAERRLRQPDYVTRGSAFRGGLRALQSARMAFRALSKSTPEKFGVFAFTMPAVTVVVERAP